MYENINKELLEVKELIRSKERVQSKLNHAEVNLDEEKKRKFALEAILEKEDLDVKKLEGLNLKALFLTVLGNKDEQLSKEKQEALAAKLKYDECCNSVNLLKEEIEGYYYQLKELSSAESNYEALLKEKKEMILQKNDKYSAEILALTEELSDLEINLKELKEAISAGNDLKYCLESASRSLDSAENWGTWDMLGGGFLSTMAKHSHIDDASDHISKARSYLNRFTRELQDVHIDRDIHIDISSFDKFADYFFDGLFADWNVQSKIHSSQSSVDNAISQIEGILVQLKVSGRNIEEKISSLKSKIQNIVENAADLS